MSWIKFFNFYEDPFKERLDDKYYYESNSLMEGIARLEMFKNRKGIFHLYGGTGIGKTIILKRFVRQVGSEYKIVYINYTNTNAYGLLNILSEKLGLSSRNTKANYEKQLTEYFRESRQENIVIIDEAQNLAFDALEEIKLLSADEFEKGYKFSVILSSLPELRNKLSGIPTLRRRIFLFYKVKPLDKNETKEYIKQRISQVTSGAEVPIENSAIEKIFTLTGGVMGEINKICTLCLISAWTEKERMINLGTVEKANMELKLYQE